MIQQRAIPIWRSLHLFQEIREQFHVVLVHLGIFRQLFRVVF